MSEIADTFDSAFTKAVDLGNRLADKDKDADSYLTREFNEDDGVMQPRFEMSFKDESPIADFRDK